MTHAEKAKQLFLNGCNCSQSIVCAWADELGIDETTARKISCGLGGGVGRLREICGAVSGAATVISMLFSGDDGRDRATVYGLIQDFAE
ncbi:MAG: C-GCAxxG-C-C family (seleno)protein, partial [Acutalibacteraceae bacterium]